MGYNQLICYNTITTSLYKGSHYGYPIFYCIIIFVPNFKLILYSKPRSYERGFLCTRVKYVSK
nr:MAG TPA_asm: hypothetical protein [Caudoviricetes sp.]